MINSGQKSGLLLQGDKTVPFISSFGSMDPNYMEVFFVDHIYISIDRILSQLYSGLDIRGNWKNMILNRNELALLDAIEKSDFKEITIKPLNSAELFSVRITENGTLSSEDSRRLDRVIKEVLGLKSYHSIKLSTRNGRLVYFENESIHSDGLGALKPTLENPTDSAGPDIGDNNVNP